MGALAGLERFFERLFERPASRLFRTHVQPIQVQRRIERAMETERSTGIDRTYAPNLFRVHLHPDDLVAFTEMAESLAEELADAALAFARLHRFQLMDRPRVELVEDAAVRSGDIRVSASFHGGRRPPVVVADDAGLSDSHAAGSTSAPGVGSSTPARGAGSLPRDGRAVSGDTMVFEVPEVHAPSARLVVTTPDGGRRDVVVAGAAMTIGRAADNTVRIADSRVSRHHARLQVRRGTLVLTDLGSTNGTRVNGIRIDEVALGEGDRIELGDSAIVVERRASA